MSVREIPYFVSAKLFLVIDKLHNRIDGPQELDYKARKGIVHAIRFGYYGIQLVKYNRIVNYGEANDIFHQVMALPEDTEPAKFERLYKPLFTGRLPRFHRLTLQICLALSRN